MIQNFNCDFCERLILSLIDKLIKNLFVVCFLHVRKITRNGANLRQNVVKETSITALLSARII